MKNKNGEVHEITKRFMKLQLQCYLRIISPLTKMFFLSLKKLGSLVCVTAQTKLPSKNPPIVFNVVVLYFKDTPLLHIMIVHPLSLTLTLCSLVEKACTPLGGLFRWQL